MAGLKVAAVDDRRVIVEVRGGQELDCRSYRLNGSRRLRAPFTLTEPDSTLAAEHRAFAIHDSAHGTTGPSPAAPTPPSLALPLPHDLGTVRVNLHAPAAEPELQPLLGPAGRGTWISSVEQLDDGRIVVVPAHATSPLERLVVDGST